MFPVTSHCDLIALMCSDPPYLLELRYPQGGPGSCPRLKKWQALTAHISGQSEPQQSASRAPAHQATISPTTHGQSSGDLNRNTRIAIRGATTDLNVRNFVFCWHDSSMEVRFYRKQFSLRPVTFNRVENDASGLNNRGEEVPQATLARRFPICFVCHSDPILDKSSSRRLAFWSASANRLIDLA
jgi:hypothetical protein